MEVRDSIATWDRGIRIEILSSEGFPGSSAALKIATSVPN